MKIWTRSLVACAATAGLVAAGASGAYAQDRDTPRPATPSGASSGASSMAGQKTADMLKPADKTFATKVAQDGMAEIELGKLAEQKGSHPQVKSFGERMQTDHAKANDELKTLASEKGVTLPASPNQQQEALKTKLDKLDGAAFDRAYADAMVQDHQKAVSEFEKESKSASDADVKAFAAKTLPTLREHLRLAREMKSAVSGAAATSGTRPAEPGPGGARPTGNGPTSGSPGYPNTR